jgi:Tol biopolymer transport system component
VLQRVWAATLDGASAVPLSGSTLSFGEVWSPTGDRLLLAINDGGTRYALATVNRDGTGYRQITSYDDGIGGGVWSPDGAVIGTSDRVGQIVAMNADGSARRRLTAGSPFKAGPVWNPKARAVGSLSGDRTRTSPPTSPR